MHSLKLSNKNFISKITKNWYKLYLLLSIFFLVFIYGILVGNYHIFPFKIFNNARLAAEDLFKNDNYKHYAKIRPEKFIVPARHDGNGVTINIPEKAYDAYTLITSMWNDTSGFKLIDMDGTELYHWNVSLNKIWSASSFGKDRVTDWDVDIHGTIVYPNGDLLLNFNTRGLLKVDKHSKTIWSLKDEYHHTIFEDEDGNLWIPSREILYKPDKKLPLLKPPYYKDYICVISPDGEIIKRTSLLEIFYKSGMESLLLADGSRLVEKVANDITHLNDIEVLSSKYAKYYPQFNEGDYMVSLRHLNLIMVIDRSTDIIKWSMIGPFLRQHDPDFTQNGDILVFDNRTDDSLGEILGGSRILSIDPRSRNVNVSYQGNSKNSFFSNIAGKQQLLPNGNLLITEHGAGRVFEVNDNDEVVWSYVNRYDEDEVYLISDAFKLPKNYFTFLSTNDE